MFNKFNSNLSRTGFVLMLAFVLLMVALLAVQADNGVTDTYDGGLVSSTRTKGPFYLAKDLTITSTDTVTPQTCIDTADYESMDLQLSISNPESAALVIALMHTNVDGATPADVVNSATGISKDVPFVMNPYMYSMGDTSVLTDTEVAAINEIYRIPVYGATTCLLVMSTGAVTDPVIVDAIGLAR